MNLEAAFRKFNCNKEKNYKKYSKKTIKNIVFFFISKLFVEKTQLKLLYSKKSNLSGFNLFKNNFYKVTIRIFKIHA